MSKEWVKEWEHAGFKCRVWKHPYLGHFCGYVVLPKTHPYAGKNSQDIDVDVHGGLTFHGWEGDDYIVGFNCAHAGDLVPGLLTHSLGEPGERVLDEQGHLWTVEEVVEETNRLAEQLKVENLVARKLAK